MKFFPKILTIFFLLIFILQLTCLLFLTLAPNASLAADPATFKPQVEIPGLEKEFTKDKTGGYILPQDTGGIAKYIRAIYKYAIGIVGILAAVVLMIGGVMWIMAGGSATMIGEAKAWIGASLTGLTLALLSYLILATVNPALVDLRTTAIRNVAPVAGITTFDTSTPCGQQIQDQNIICGSKCPNGQTCEKTSNIIVGAKECPETLSGNGNYYVCSDLSGGGTDCCDNNNDNQCQSINYVCNMRITPSIQPPHPNPCVFQGVCTLKQKLDGVCGEDNDCINNLNCDTGLFGTYKCQQNP